MDRRILSFISCLGLIALLLPVGAATATVRKPTPIRIIHAGPDYNEGRALPIRGGYRTSGAESGSAGRLRIGKTKLWGAIDDVEGGVYLKRYKLRGKGDHVEVWVAADSDEISQALRFPEGDCRNDERVKITDRQVNRLVRQFDRNIYPKESRVFSKPPKRGGSKALLYSREVISPPFPEGYYKGQGDNIVVLVDNVRDDAFYDTNNENELPYIAGFFFSVFNELHDRNVMTIDGYDWLHRSGANPPNEPVPGDPCLSKPARPNLYESTFAHEYQHLLEYYEDPDEVNWVNEGLSDWAQTLTGYANPRTPITETGFDSHIQCFLGWLEVQTDANPNPRDGGPENSLNLWEEQEGEILCDYGAPYSMMEMLRSRYGRGFMGKLHRNNANGLPGLQRLLAQAADGKSARDVLHEWQVMVALDGVLDDGAVLSGGEAALFQAKSLDATINWDNDDTYSEEGAPPNGADYVRLRDQSGAFLAAEDIESISFDGAETVEPDPVEWTVVQNPPGQENDPALYSGSEVNADRAIVQQVSVPAQDPTLTFEHWYALEETWDFGFVQVSTDGGQTYESLSNANTTSGADPQADPRVVDELPGFTGNSGCESGAQIREDCSPSWVTETFDLSDYAGEDILLAFRYIGDIAVNLENWYIDDIAVGGKKISQGSTIAEWQSADAVNPQEVEGFTVQLIAYDEARTVASYLKLPLGSGFTGTLTGDALDEFLPDNASVVAALVTYDESTERVDNYAPYVLEVNGVTQPGG